MDTVTRSWARYRSIGLALCGVVGLAIAPAVSAETLISASYQLLAAHPAGTGDAALPFSGGSELGSTGFSVGQLSVVGFAGAAGSLDTAASGFWPIVLGGFANIDTDGDGIASPFDDDDDGDGLPDTVESGRGIFVGPGDVGSSPVVSDSDGDGFADGTEVAAGTDPNDPMSFPVGVPAVGFTGWLLLCGLLALVGRTAITP